MHDFSHGGRGRHHHDDMRHAHGDDRHHGRHGAARFGREALRAAIRAGFGGGDERGGFGGRFGQAHGGHDRHHGGGRFGGGGFGGGFGGPFRGGFDDDAPRQRRGKRFDGEALRLLVLALLAEAPQHGYQLIRTFAARSGDAYQPSPGVLYPLLAMLTDQGLLTEADGETAGPGRRRSFSITEAGAAELAANAEIVTALFARLAALGGGEDGVDVAPVRRAMHGLRASAIEGVGRAARAARPGGQSAPADETDGIRATVLEIARLIDEVTQKIERL